MAIDDCFHAGLLWERTEWKKKIDKMCDLARKGGGSEFKVTGKAASKAVVACGRWTGYPKVMRATELALTCRRTLESRPRVVQGQRSRAGPEGVRAGEESRLCFLLTVALAELARAVQAQESWQADQLSSSPGPEPGLRVASLPSPIYPIS